MNKKQCFKCREIKPLSDFYKHPKTADKHLNKCKECAKRDRATYHQSHHATVMAYEKKRRQQPKRKAWQREYARGKTEKPSLHDIARKELKAAVRSKKLTRKPCEICGATIRVEAHHTDYSKPLDVQWLCFKHHREIGHNQRTSPF